MRILKTLAQLLNTYPLLNKKQLLLIQDQYPHQDIFAEFLTAAIRHSSESSVHVHTVINDMARDENLDEEMRLNVYLEALEESMVFEKKTIRLLSRHSYCRTHSVCCVCSLFN